MDSLEALIYCLSHGFPAPVTAAMLALVDDADDDRLTDALIAWNGWNEYHALDFFETVETIIGEGCTGCERCSSVIWDDDATAISGGGSVCESCRDNHYSMCTGCEEYYGDRYIRTEGDSSWCEQCFDNNFHFCDHCDRYVHDDDGDHDHGSSCDCVAPHLKFTFPADGHGVIEQDERLTVELPKGTIDDPGLHAIKKLLYTELGDWHTVEKVVDGVGALWQAKRGNFTKRLSAAFFNNHSIKLAPHVISEVGNLARAHSSEGATWHVEFTRDLNQSADAFYHEESCWWQSYSYSRCSLKNWGGLGLRCYENTTITDDCPNGRAWVQPLNANMQPTHDTINAHAYVVFNGYGDLDGYIAARIIAHLAGRTYRKIGLSAERQYINNSTGYLVADDATCAGTESLFFGDSEHDQHDAYTYEKEAAVA